MHRPDPARCALVLSFLLAAYSGLAASSALAAVEFHDWREAGFQAAVDEAARGRQLVALVVTQPDWCPPCIRLNANWLQNPEDREVSGLLRDALVLEVLGYDEPGALLLRSQGVKFQGTPTVLVFSPRLAGRPLGEAELLGSIVGAPADFPARLRSIVEGQDPVPGLKARLAAESRPIEKARLALELADALAARGDGDGAVRALREVREARRSARGLEELDLLVREAEWTRAASVELRVNKDAATALHGIDAWIGRHGREARDPKDIAYARAWALAQLGRVEEARAEMSSAFLQPGQEGLETYAYFAFRVGGDALLADAEAHLRQARVQRADEGDEGDWQGSSADLHGALGRVLRKQGRHAEALQAFERAVALSQGESRLVWQGQLDWCRNELEAQASG